jgi:chromosome segregation ATPase
MGIFDWLFAKKQQGPMEHTIRLTDLNNHLYLIKKAKYDNVYDEFENLKNQVLKHISTIQKELETLESSYPDMSDVDPRLAIKINSAKENFLKIIDALCEDYNEKSSPTNSLAGIGLFLELTKYTIDEFNKTWKFSEITGLKFKREINNIAMNIKRIIEIYKNCKSRSDELGIAKFEKIEKKAKDLDELMKYRQKIEYEVDMQNTELAKEKKRIAIIEREKEQYENTNEFKSTKEVENNIEKLESELKDLKLGMRNKFSEFSKAVAKAVHDSALSSDEEKLAKSYLEEPINALDLDPNLKINSLLDRVRSDIEKNVIVLDERLRSKTVKAIEKFVNNNEFGLAREKKHDLDEEIGLMEDELKKSGVYTYNLLNVKLKNTKKSAADIETAISVQGNLLKKNSLGVEKLKNELQKLLEEINVKATFV